MCDRQKFDNVDAPFANFVLCDEALGFAEAIGELLLSQTRFLSSGDEQLDESDMIVGT